MADVQWTLHLEKEQVGRIIGIKRRNLNHIISLSHALVKLVDEEDGSRLHISGTAQQVHAAKQYVHSALHGGFMHDLPVAAMAFLTPGAVEEMAARSHTSIRMPKPDEPSLIIITAASHKADIQGARELLALALGLKHKQQAAGPGQSKEQRLRERKQKQLSKIEYKQHRPVPPMLFGQPPPQRPLPRDATRAAAKDAAKHPTGRLAETMEKLESLGLVSQKPSGASRGTRSRKAKQPAMA